MADLIDRAAVAAFLKGYWGSIGGGMPEGPADEAILNTITAFETAIAALPAQGVRVKPLEWRHHDAVGDLGFAAHDEAVGIGGYYNIEFQDGGHFCLWLPETVKGTRFPTLDAAKAAAQADYERRILDALAPAEAGGVEELISDARLECEALCARFLAGEASEKEVVDTIEKIARDNERLAVLLGEAKAAARYSVSAEWAENMLPADEGVTPAAGSPDDEAAMHIETALAMARVQEGYASKATGEGEKMIFKANAKAQRQIADYIRRTSTAALEPAEAGGVEADSQIAKPCAQRICGLADGPELCGARPGEPCRGRTVIAPVDALVEAGGNLRSFVDLFAGGDEAMRLAVREFDAALAAIRGEQA